MNNRQFENICRETAIALRVSDVEDFVQCGAFEIDDVDVALHFNEELDEDRIFCYLDIGRIGAGNANVAMRNLLELNLLTGGSTLGSYAFDPAHGNALLVVHLGDLDNLDGQIMANALCDFAAQAREARDAVFHSFF